MLISEQPTWNPIQCWVWIRFRTNEALNVLGAGTAYASYVTYEHEENRSANDRPFQEICPNATEELSTKLIKGIITATGTDPDTNRTIEIDRNWWRNATLSRLNPGDTQVGTPKYTNILLEASDITLHWPENAKVSSGRGGPRSVEEIQAENLANAYIRKIAREFHDNPHGTVKNTISELVKRFEHLRPAGAKRAWAAAAPARWSKPGRKPTKKN